MKKLLAKLSAVSVLVLAASMTQALEQPYLGVDYIQSTYEYASGDDASPTMAQLRFGADMTKYLGMEARTAFGIDDDKVSGANYNINITGVYTLGVVGRLPFGKHASLYAYAGYSYAQMTAESTDPGFPDIETNDDGLSYGAGVVFPISRQYLLEADYTSYFDNEKYTFSGVSVGVRRYL